MATRTSDERLAEQIDRHERYIMDNWTDNPDEQCLVAAATISALCELQGFRAAEREQPAVTPTGNPHGETLGEAGERFARGCYEMGRKVGEALAPLVEPEPSDYERVTDKWLDARITRYERCLGENTSLPYRALRELRDRRNDDGDPDDGEWTGEPEPAPRGWVGRLWEEWRKQALRYCEQEAFGEWAAVLSSMDELQAAYAAHQAKPAKWERRLKEMNGTLRPGRYGEDDGPWVCLVDLGDLEAFCADTAKAAVAAAWRAFRGARDGK